MLRDIFLKLIVILSLGTMPVPTLASESQPNPIPPQQISIARLETVFAVDPSAPDVDPQYVRDLTIRYFADIPVMIAICECESNFRHYRADGTLNINRTINPATKKRISSATGVCQMLYKTHYPRWAVDPTTNITTVEGNLAFARAVYETEGTTPWQSSQRCWGPKAKRYARQFATS